MHNEHPRPEVAALCHMWLEQGYSEESKSSSEPWHLMSCAAQVQAARDSVDEGASTRGKNNTRAASLFDWCLLLPNVAFNCKRIVFVAFATWIHSVYDINRLSSFSRSPCQDIAYLIPLRYNPLQIKVLWSFNDEFRAFCFLLGRCVLCGGVCDICVLASSLWLTHWLTWTEKKMSMASGGESVCVNVVPSCPQLPRAPELHRSKENECSRAAAVSASESLVFWYSVAVSGLLGSR